MVKMLVVLDHNGQPILSRSYGGLPPPSFPTVALMSSCVTFAEHHEYDLRRMASDHARVAFSSFDTGLLIVIVTNDLDMPENELYDLCKYAHDGISLVLGEEAVREGASNDRKDKLKREVRAAAPLLDQLMMDDRAPIGVALAAAEMALPLDSVPPAPHDTRADAPSPPAPQWPAAYSPLTEAVVLLAEAAGAEHAAILIRGRYTAATAEWWGLPGQEQFLLQQLVASLPPAAQRDVPVYLPTTSPAVPFRLLTAALSRGAELVLLAGPAPDLRKVASLARAHLGPLSREIAAASDAEEAGGHPGVGEVLEGWGVGGCLLLQRAPPRVWCWEAGGPGGCGTRSPQPRSPGSDPFAAGQEPRGPEATTSDMLVTCALSAGPLLFEGGGEGQTELDLPRHAQALAMGLEVGGRAAAAARSGDGEMLGVVVLRRGEPAAAAIGAAERALRVMAAAAT